MSPGTILTPSKASFILSHIVGIEINVDAGYTVISKFEHIAETSARSLAPCPRFNRMILVSSKQRPFIKSTFPVVVSDDVIVAADGSQLSTFEEVPYAVASCDGLACRSERVILHAVAIQKDVVADEEQILEDVKGKSRRMAPHMEAFDALMHEVPFKCHIEREGPADVVHRIAVVDVHLGVKEVPVEIGSTKKMVVSEQDCVRPLQRRVKR